MIKVQCKNVLGQTIVNKNIRFSIMATTKKMKLIEILGSGGRLTEPI